MPSPQPQPEAKHVQQVAKHAIIAGIAITVLKFLLFAVSDSVAVFTDAMESIINIAAAGFVLYSLRLSNQPADLNHPYGHGKIEFFAVLVEGWFILSAAVIIAYKALARFAGYGQLNLERLDGAMIGLIVVAALSAVLAGYVYWAGWKYDNETLKADSKHLFTDVFSTVVVLLGLYFVRITGWAILDPVTALLVAVGILFVSYRLMRRAIRGLMDEVDPADQQKVIDILDHEVAAGHIQGYHKVRLRHQGAFHWIDLHLHMDGELTVEDAHREATLIERRIEQALKPANATAHVEPYRPELAPSPPPDPRDPAAAPPASEG